MSYSELALNCWLLFQIFGVATRARTLLTARWNEHITFLRQGLDVRITLGDTSDSPGGKKTKHSFPLDTKLSDLQGLDDAGLLRTDIARTALSWLWNRTEFHGLVFSRADVHGSDSPFGKDRFNQAMTALIGFTDGCGKLRKRLETDACAMLKAGTITPAVRALVSSLQQHKGSTAALDYVKVSTDSTDKKDVKEVVDKVVDKVVKQAEDAELTAGSKEAEDTPEKTPFTVLAGYDCNRVFRMDRDLREAQHWEFKHNKLTIWWDGTGKPEVVELDPDDFDHDFKRPDIIRVQVGDTTPDVIWSTPTAGSKEAEEPAAEADGAAEDDEAMVTAKALAGAFGKKQAEIELLKAQIAELKAGSATQAEQPPLVRQNAVSGGEDFGGGDGGESDSTDEKPAPVVAKTGDLVEITHDYNGTSNLLVTIDGESVLLELVQSPGNPDHNWTFAPHLKNSKHHLAHLVDYGVHQVCISPSPDLSAMSPMDLIVNFGPTGVELVQVGQPFEGKYYLRLAGHTDSNIVNDGDDGGGGGGGASVLAELDRSIATMAEDEAMVSMEVSNALRVSAKLATAWRMNPPKTVGEEESFKRYGDIADFGLERAKRLRVQ